MRIVLLITLLLNLYSFAQEIEGNIKPVKAFHIDLSIGGGIIHTYNNFNSMLTTTNIDPLSGRPFQAAFGAGFYHNESDFNLEIFTAQSNNGASDSSYALNLGLYGFNITYAYDLGYKLKKWTLKPFAGVGMNAMQLTGRSNGDTTVSNAGFLNGAYNLYFNRSTPQLTIDFGFSSSVYWLYPSPNSELFLKAYYSLGLIDYSWLANDLPINSTSRFCVAFGIRFNLSKYANRRED